MQSLRNVSRLLFALVLVAAVGCQSDSPTEPSSSSPPISPKPPDPVTTFIVDITASPSELVAGGETSSNIVVKARRSDNGQPPPDLTPVTLTTTLGGFGSAGGPNSVVLQLVNGEASAVLFPGDSLGTATVRAVVGPSAGATTVRINPAATFFVGSVQPSIGDPEGGDEVSIIGGGFESPVRVTFNGTAATVLSVTPTRIRVLTPSADAAGVPVNVGQTATVDVSVTINVNEANQDTDALSRGFTYAFGDGGGPGQPQVFSVTPASGSNDGGDRVTISGAGFRSPVQVLFGIGATADTFDGVEATVESVSDNQIVVRTPAARGFGQNLVNQVVNILIRNINSGFSTLSLQRFKYGSEVLITAVSLDTRPTGGRTPVEGGFRVVIQGQGFDEPVAAEFRFADVSIGQSVVSVTGTQVVVLAGPAPIPDECPDNGIIEVEGIQVVNIETGDGDDADIGFSYVVPRPLVFGINPISGNPGINATITGRDFSDNVQVLFGGADNGSSAQIISRSATSITVRIPNAPQGFQFITEPCDGNGDGNPGGTRLTPTPISVTVRNLETDCVSTLSNAFVLNPPNTTCTGDDTTPPPAPVTQCTDGFDNDSDGFTDAADPQCTGPADNSESS